MEKIVSNDTPCEKCSLEFGNRVVLNMHMALVHKVKVKTSKQEKIVKLENETNTFSEQAISANVANKSSSIIEMYNCSKCDYNSLYPSNLKRHSKCVHEKQKPHKCSMCDYSCSQKGSLKTHVESVHGKQKPHKCSI